MAGGYVNKCRKQLKGSGVVDHNLDPLSTFPLHYLVSFVDIWFRSIMWAQCSVGNIYSNSAQMAENYNAGI